MSMYFLPCHFTLVRLPPTLTGLAIPSRQRRPTSPGPTTRRLTPANLCGHRTREAGRRHAIRVADQGGEVEVGLRASLTAGEALEAELSRSCALSFYDQRVVHLARPHRNADHGDRPGGVREPPGTAGNRHLAR